MGNSRRWSLKIIDISDLGRVLFTVHFHDVWRPRILMTALSFRTNAILVTLVCKVAACFPKARITLVGKNKDAWTPNIAEMRSEKYTPESLISMILRLHSLEFPILNSPVKISERKKSWKNGNVQKINFFEHESE